MRKFSLLLTAISFIGVLSGCASNPPAPLVTKATTSQVLLDLGNRLGIDFSSSVFADQTICYDDFDKYYGNNKIVYSIICSKQKGTHTNIYWVRNYVFEDNFAARTAMRLGELNSIPLKETAAIFQKKDKNKHYYLVKVGSGISYYQGIFFHRTEKSEKLGLEMVFLVKSARLEEAEKMLQELELTVKETQKTASLAN